MKKNITAFHVIAAFLFLFYNADKSTPLKKPFPIQFAISETIIIYPKIEHIYTNYLGNTNQLYGKGFSYTKIVKEIPVKRDDIENRIKNKEFDLIIYGAVHHELPFHDLRSEEHT